ncbi:hypothetical protein SAMN04488554_0903 [Ruania alba]|uniref:Uncharacterized protein n=1 Tax=Ruania alba TaxID=648782 RepID=A0A1H5E5X7_9MICO|nr:hypothetical protein SAMN04488554_0903 [Ruania alba]
MRDDVAAALVDVDPAEAERRASRRRQDRHVSRPRAHSDGVASLRIEGPAADVLTLDLALDAAARGAKARGDNRTLDQLRFDCLATVGGHALATGRLGPAEVGLPLATENGRRPEIQVQVSLADLIPPDPGGDTEASDGPARSAASAPILAGYGPITPTAARALAAGGTWRRVVTDPVTGTVLNVGRTRYRPTTAIAEHVRTRDRTCVRPGCEHRASSCQLDHTDEWRDPERYRRGGSTSVTNLAPLCTRDHLIKTHGDFGVTQVEPGVFEWRTPSGHRYRRERDGSTRLLSHCTPMRPIVMVGPADRGRYEDAGGGRGDAIVMHEGWSSASGDQELEPPF